MARHRTSRSPSPAGSHVSSRKNRRDDNDRDRSRRDEPRERHRSRSPDVRRKRGDDDARGAYSNRRDEQHRYRDEGRDRERRSENYVRRRDDDYDRSGRQNGGSHRDRRRSPDRHRDRSPARRDRSRDRYARDRDRYQDRRPESPGRYGGRRDVNTESSRARDRADDSRHKDTATSAHNDSMAPKSPAQASLDKKAEKLAKLEAWKRQKAQAAKEAATAAVTTRQVLADVQSKATTPATAMSPMTITSTIASPKTPQDDTPPAPYAGKFDPKAIAKKSAPRSHTPTLLGDMKTPAAPPIAAINNVKAAAAPSSTTITKPIGEFGFGKSGPVANKVPAKRKMILDEEETTQRKLAKLPDISLENADETPYVNQDEAESESDDDNFAGTEEEAAAAARAAHDRREERLLQQSMTIETDGDKAEVVDESIENVEAAEQATIATAPIIPLTVEPETESMDVDEEVDPLDAFMDGMDSVPKPAKKLTPTATKPTRKATGPEMYFSDEEYGFDRTDERNPKAILALAAAAKKKKKEIPTIDYSKITLNVIRKNFWVEPSELKDMTEAELAELRLELDGIKVAGKDIPKPVQKWSHCGLTQPMLNVVEKLGYEKPTSIQMQALPVIMSGRDVIGVAKTGSGKTMAFLLPMFRHIKDQEPVKDDGPIGLILTPTRELATQIFRDCKPFLQALGLRGVCAYGGPPIKDQITELKRGCDVCVCTTGRMIDLLAANQGRVVDLKRTTYIVLDEADRMFDMGFEPQVMKIFANIRPDRQTLLFSATMPRIIDALVKKVLRNPVEITVGGRSVVAPEITQVVEIRAENEKFVRLLELLGELYANDEDVRALIFVERQEKADDLLRELLRKGYGSMSIHGGKDQSDRDSTIADFKNGVCPVLVATSVAARGLDVKQLKLVVNYDAPNHLEDYVHRAGRTGRAGNTGTAVTFVTEEQENCAPGIAKALEQSGQPVPEQLEQMRKAFREKVKAGQAKDQSGFGGKGLDRLDKDREAARMRERKTHKAEGEDEDDKEETAADDEKKAKAATAIESAASAVVARDPAPRTEPEPVEMPAIKSAVKAGLHASAAGKGGALDKAAQAVNDINARLARAGQLRPGQSIDNKGPDAGAFHATLEINDFPQKARWAVTNRTNVAKILEATGTSITTKGTFYAAGKEPAAGAEPKLYILIEGDTEVVVSNALSELTRLLKDGAIAAADAESRAPVSGRYKIT